MPKHSLFRLSQKLKNTPHLIEKSSFDSIASYLNSRNTNMMLLPQKAEEDEGYDEPDDLDDLGGIGVINVSGPLTYKDTGWEFMCGGCSYESILEQADEYVDNGATALVMVFDSGGGEAYGAFETASRIRTICDDAGIPLIAYVDGCCCSAAYALACVADEVIINPYADVGSIGVLICLLDDSKYMEEEGFKNIYITAGSEKIPYNDDGSFRTEFLSDLQEKVDYLYDAFCTHVATYTGLSVQDVKNTEAKVYMAQDALSIGLANKIMSNVEFVQYVASIQRGME